MPIGGGVGAHGPSIKLPHVYEALRRAGYDKSKSARISNAMWNGTWRGGIKIKLTRGSLKRIARVVRRAK